MITKIRQIQNINQAAEGQIQRSINQSIICNILFFENRLVKACHEHALFRNDSVKSFLSLIPHLHYRRKDARPIRGFSTLENYKQRRSDSCSPSEPNPVGHSKYQVLSNYSATDRGFKRFAYLLYQSLPQTTYALCKYVSRLCTKVEISIAT